MGGNRTKTGRTSSANTKRMSAFDRACTVLNALFNRGVRHMVLSPGSRNAPVMLALSHFPNIQVTLQPDERSAAYTAMGVAQATNLPTVVCCTSGTAAANYLPAIVEAHYMQVPLIALTADRPSTSVDQRRGQTIRQPHLYGDYVHSVINFSDDDLDEDLLGEILCCPDNGPTHINLPLSEPLYETVNFQPNVIPVDDILRPTVDPPKQAVALLQNAERPMLLVGQMTSNQPLSEELVKWKEASVLIAAEALANQPRDLVIQHIDRWCRQDDFQPDLIVAIGRDWVSKTMKNRFTCPIIHIEDISKAPNAFGEVTVHYKTDALRGLQQLRPYLSTYDKAFAEHWCAVDAQQKNILDNTDYPWSDFTAIRQIMRQVESDELLHLGNSSVVRYGLLSLYGNFPIYSNRGTAGIDGSLSTAMGQVIGAKQRGWCVLGDVSFFYDHNALWLKNPMCVPIVINNGGGHIFQLIDGPKKQPQIAEWQQSPTGISVEHIAKAFGYHHLVADSESSLVAAITTARNANQSYLIEVMVDSEVSVGVWEALIKKLKIENWSKSSTTRGGNY